MQNRIKEIREAILNSFIEQFELPKLRLKKWYDHTDKNTYLFGLVFHNLLKKLKKQNGKITTEEFEFKRGNDYFTIVTEKVTSQNETVKWRIIDCRANTYIQVIYIKNE